MTIRRCVDLKTINNDYGSFETACGEAPHGVFDIAKTIQRVLGDACDNLLADARAYSIEVSTCDGIREIEALMFDMIRANATTAHRMEIDAAIGCGRALDAADDAERGAIMHRLARDKGFIATREEWTKLGFIRDDDSPNMFDGPMTYRQDSDALIAGPGDLWMVRVESNLDELDYVDIEVRALTMEDAADKAEAHARRHPDMYFDVAPVFTCYAKRQDIHRIDEDVDDGEDRYAGSDLPYPGQEG
jgi:hypothetical protein